MGLDVGAQSRYNYTFVNDDAGDVISQNTDKINMILKISVPLVCVPFDFMSMVMPDTFPFSVAGACFFWVFLNIFTFD